jgi:hypothetical protein
MEPAGPPPAEFRLRSLEPESRRDITADVDVKLQGVVAELASGADPSG